VQVLIAELGPAVSGMSNHEAGTTHGVTRIIQDAGVRAHLHAVQGFISSELWKNLWADQAATALSPAGEQRFRLAGLIFSVDEGVRQCRYAQPPATLGHRFGMQSKD
jgi:hypothetical protein